MGIRIILENGNMKIERDLINSHVLYKNVTNIFVHLK